MTHPRSAWVSPAQPVTGPPINWRRIDTVVIHYTAAADCPEGDDRSAYARFLRSLQASYLASRGYSLGYSVAVATVGESWAIRWTDIAPAATKGHNGHTFAILVTVDGDRPASSAAVAEVRRLVGMAATLAGRSLRIVGHGELGATACPGAGLRAQIAAGVFTPTSPPPIPEDDDAMFYLTSPQPGTLPDLIWYAGKVYGISSVADAEQFLAAGAKRLTVSLAQYNEITETSR
jgi:hypothetical protein